MDFHLPFKVGQSAEAKSFQSGFRCAWFRCKIKVIKQRKGEWHALLEYFDFPDEKLRWLKLYQQPPYRLGKSTSFQRQLMLRPCYPPIGHESEISNASSVPDTRVIVHGTWQAGDSVDWWNSDCYWSGKVTKILDNVKVEIELTPPPIGEGGSYEVYIKDLRPSLDWSLEHSWTVPTYPDGEKGHSRVQLIQPISRDLGGNLDVHTLHESQKEVGSTLESNTQVNIEDSGNRENSIFGCDSVKDVATEIAGQTGDEDENLCYVKCPLDKLRTSGGVALNSTRCETLEAAIMDLEEMRNKVKWLKKILESGNPAVSSSLSMWKFKEHCASSAQK